MVVCGVRRPHRVRRWEAVAVSQRRVVAAQPDEEELLSRLVVLAVAALDCAHSQSLLQWPRVGSSLSHKC